MRHFDISLQVGPLVKVSQGDKVISPLSGIGMGEYNINLAENQLYSSTPDTLATFLVRQLAEQIKSGELQDLIASGLDKAFRRVHLPMVITPEDIENETVIPMSKVRMQGGKVVGDP